MTRRALTGTLPYHPPSRLSAGGLAGGGPSVSGEQPQVLLTLGTEEARRPGGMPGQAPPSALRCYASPRQGRGGDEGEDLKSREVTGV